MELKLNSSAQFASDVFVTRRRGANLQPDSGRILIEGLQAEDARSVDKRLRPGRVVAEVSGGGIESLERGVLGNFGGDRDVDEGLGPIAAQVADGADIAIRQRNQGPSRVADHSPPES